MIKNILLTLVSYKHMKKNSGLSIVFAIIVMLTTVFLIEKAYEVNITKREEAIVLEGSAIEETKIFSSFPSLSIETIKSKNYVLDDGRLKGNDSFNKNCFISDQEYKVYIVFDIEDRLITDNIEDVYITYEIDLEESYVFVFGSLDFLYQSYNGTKRSNIVKANYGYIPINFENLENLNDFGRFIAISLVRCYIDYQVSYFTLIALFAFFIFPILISIIMYFLFRKRCEFSRFKQSLNITVFSTILLNIFYIVLTFFIDRAILSYFLMLTIVVSFNMIKIKNMNIDE